MGAADRFLQAAAARGVSPEIQHFPEGTRSASDAAAAVGCDVGQIVKSLVFMADGHPIMVLASGANRVDEVAVATAIGVAELTKADADQARAATGYVIGGTPPFGHSSELRTFVDADLMRYPVVWAAAGTPDTCFPIEPSELASAARAHTLNIGAPHATN